MKNSEILFGVINGFMGKVLGKPRTNENYKQLCDNHQVVIVALRNLWVDRTVAQPVNREKTICIQDLSPYGKGIFVGEYFYEDGHFVANLGDDDPYGCITHWISTDFFDGLPSVMLESENFMEAIVKGYENGG